MKNPFHHRFVWITLAINLALAASHTISTSLLGAKARDQFHFTAAMATKTGAMSNQDNFSTNEEAATNKMNGISQTRKERK